jgi:hypothetical protein
MMVDMLKKIVLNSLAEILQPLIDKWDKTITQNTLEAAGLERAKTDVQEIIDKARGDDDSQSNGTDKVL